MDERLLESVAVTRAAVRSGQLRGQALRQHLLAVPGAERDLWLDGVLSLPELPEDQPSLPPGTVPYLPCPVDVVLAALAEAPVGAGDVFVDLGAGLGRVVLLAQLLCGARAIGIELQPHLCAQAQQAASALGLVDAAFVCGDAAERSLDEGTVFFVYASFGLAALRRVLAQLYTVASQRRITLCAVDFAVPSGEYSWLHLRASSRCELVFYDSQV